MRVTRLGLMWGRYASGGSSPEAGVAVNICSTNINLYKVLIHDSILLKCCCYFEWPTIKTNECFYLKDTSWYILLICSQCCCIYSTCGTVALQSKYCSYWLKMGIAKEPILGGRVRKHDLSYTLSCAKIVNDSVAKFAVFTTKGSVLNILQIYPVYTVLSCSTGQSLL